VTAGGGASRWRAVSHQRSSHVIGQSAPWRHSVVTWLPVTCLSRGWPN